MKAIGPPPQPAGYTPSTLGLPTAPSLGNGTKLWLLRHAEVAESWHDKAYGSKDVPLSETGALDTKRLAKCFAKIQVDAVLSSSLTRALTMGEHVAEASSAPLQSTFALREMDRGDWQGLLKSTFIANWSAEADHYWSDPFRWHTPNGEGDELVFARAWPELERALGEVAGGTLVVTAHGQLIRVLISRMLGLNISESYDYYPDPAHASLLVDTQDGWQLSSQNLSAEALE
ncbi:MAG: broad specificity phosphatase PhoE [Planctomycetota bacterium]|jgi:broad specificity phosphatase PhoE